MKKYFIVSLILLGFISAKAQTVSFADLLNITSMNNTQVHDFLLSRGFKQLGTETVNNKLFDEYKSNRTPDKQETLLVGPGVKAPNGNTQRAVSYNTLLGTDLDNLLGQAKKSTLTLIFQGADVNRNIFRFDNSLFRATISITFDKKSGSLDVAQKDGLGN